MWLDNTSILQNVSMLSSSAERYGTWKPISVISWYIYTSRSSIILHLPWKPISVISWYIYTSRSSIILHLPWKPISVISWYIYTSRSSIILHLPWNQSVLYHDTYIQAGVLSSYIFHHSKTVVFPHPGNINFWPSRVTLLITKRCIYSASTFSLPLWLCRPFVGQTTKLDVLFLCSVPFSGYYVVMSAFDTWYISSTEMYHITLAIAR